MEINKIIHNFETRNINVVTLDTKEQLIDFLNKHIADGNSVACGGSMTLKELGVHDYLKGRSINFLDREKEGVDANLMMHEALSSDVYLASANALTENGEIFNIDGNGNRVAAMIYGPKKVILVVGENKFVDNLEEARTRVKSISAPMNGKRLKTNTPCDVTGSCADCRAPRRMCCSEVVINYQRNKERMYIVVMKGAVTK